MDERQIREALQSQRRNKLKSGFRCPDENSLAAYADGQLTGNARIDFERHLSGCESCLAAVGFLAKSAEWDQAQQAPSYLVARGRHLLSANYAPVWRWRWAMATAAAACLVLAVTFVIIKSRVNPAVTTDSSLIAKNEPTSSHPGNESSVVPPAAVPQRSIVKPPPSTEKVPTLRGNDIANKPNLQFPREGSVVPLTRLEFRWQPTRDAVRYLVRIVAEDGSLVSEKETTEPRLNFGDAPLEPSAKYFVTVKAYDGDGRVTQSEILSFRIAN